MRFPLDDIVITEGNAEAVKRVTDVMLDHEEPQRLYVYGPEQTGKSTLAMARANQKELLSTKKPMYCSAAEIMLSITIDTDSAFLDNLALTDVVFIDGFDDFMGTPDESGPMTCKLLVRERDKENRDTVIIGRKPLSEYDLTQLEGALDGFEELEMPQFDDEGRKEYVRNRAEHYDPEGDHGPKFTDDAVEYLAKDFKGDLFDLDLAIRFLKVAAELGADVTLDAQAVQEMLSLD